MARVHFRGRDEGERLHRPAGFGSDFGDFTGFDQHVRPCFVLITITEFGAVHDPVAMRTERRLFAARVAIAMKLVEINALGAGRGIEAHGN